MCEENKSPMCEESVLRVIHAQRGLIMGAQCVKKASLQCVKKVLRESSMRKEGSLWVLNV